MDVSRGGIGDGILELSWRGVDGARVATLAFVGAYASYGGAGESKEEILRTEPGRAVMRKLR